MSNVWQSIGDTPLKIGEKYRHLLNIRADYNAVNTGLLKAGFQLHGATHPEIKYTRFDHAPPLWDSHRNQFGPFVYIAEFTIVDTGEKRLEAGINPSVIWSIVALVVVASAGFFLVSKRIDHLVQTVGDELNRGLHQVLNPGVLLLAFGAIFLLAKGR